MSSPEPSNTGLKEPALGPVVIRGLEWRRSDLIPVLGWPVVVGVLLIGAEAIAAWLGILPSWWSQVKFLGPVITAMLVAGLLSWLLTKRNQSFLNAALERLDQRFRSSLTRTTQGIQRQQEEVTADLRQQIGSVSAELARAITAVRSHTDDALEKVTEELIEQALSANLNSSSAIVRRAATIVRGQSPFSTAGSRDHVVVALSAPVLFLEDFPSQDNPFCEALLERVESGRRTTIISPVEPDFFERKWKDSIIGRFLAQLAKLKSERDGDERLASYLVDCTRFLVALDEARVRSRDPEAFTVIPVIPPSRGFRQAVLRLERGTSGGVFSVVDWLWLPLGPEDLPELSLEPSALNFQIALASRGDAESGRSLLDLVLENLAEPGPVPSQTVGSPEFLEGTLSGIPVVRRIVTEQVLMHARASTEGEWRTKKYPLGACRLDFERPGKVKDVLDYHPTLFLPVKGVGRNSIYANSNALLLEYLTKQDSLLEGLRILEIGCGPGVLSALLRSSGMADEVHSIDCCERALDYARSNAARWAGGGDGHFYHGNATELQWSVTGGGLCAEGFGERMEDVSLILLDLPLTAVGGETLRRMVDYEHPYCEGAHAGSKWMPHSTGTLLRDLAAVGEWPDRATLVSCAFLPLGEEHRAEAKAEWDEYLSGWKRVRWMEDPEGPIALVEVRGADA